MISKQEIDRINHSTKFMVDSGHFILQAHRFDTTDAGHAEKLLSWLNVPRGAKVIDMGSGTGAISFLWSQIRPDLKFCLVNISSFQLSLLPKFCDQICCDMEDVPLEDGLFDAAVCLFSIGHTNYSNTIREMARLVKKNGIVFVYDMLGKSEKISELSYKIASRKEIEAAAKESGLSLDFYMEPNDIGSEASKIEGFHEVFGGLRPVIWRWVK